MLDKINKILAHRYSHQPEFCQAVQEFIVDIEPIYSDYPQYEAYSVIERMIEPDRVITFRVCWEDDRGKVHVNRGWRVQFNNALGPYKGGLRFHPNVNESILKFLGFEQCIKNSLTNLPIGGGKGGSDFNPKGKSEREVMRFCHAFMEELQHHIGPDTDVPAGDIGVGPREIGYLFGHYLKLTNEFTGTLTGKMPSFGGSCGRVEATGYGCIYFLREVLKAHDDSLTGKKVLISGAGNVALHVAQKCLDEDAKVLTLSDSSGMIFVKNGITQELLNSIKEAKFEVRESLASWYEKCGYDSIQFDKQRKPWSVEADIAIPSATENELEEQDAKQLVKHDVKVVIEGANMPLTEEALAIILENPVIYVPGIAANAGGVAVSSFERTQNSQHMTWPLQTVEQKLCEIMSAIHQSCIKHISKDKGVYPYKQGANLAGFQRLAEALVAYGLK